MRPCEKYAARDKHLLCLERELNRLLQAQWTAPIIPLEHPYQRGWIKTYVLRPDVARRSDADIFIDVLAKINRRVFSRGRDFRHANGGPVSLAPRIIPVAEWERLGWTQKHRRLFGFGHWRSDHYWNNRHIPAHHNHVLGFKLVHDSWLREDIQPNLITHQRVELPEVRRRIAEIEAHFKHNDGCHRLNNLHGRRNYWCDTSRARHNQAKAATVGEFED
ncbi:MAG: hypothetical protein LBM04_13835 [Opitutaceae bacterium]|jgi:hypothetical protein|nr:hypothetical protein [Opitutaceae bacterium]